MAIVTHEIPRTEDYFRSFQKYNKPVLSSDPTKSPKFQHEPPVSPFLGSLGEATENSPRFQPWVGGGEWPEPLRGERAAFGARNVFGRPSGTRFLCGDATQR